MEEIVVIGAEAVLLAVVVVAVEFELDILCPGEHMMGTSIMVYSICVRAVLLHSVEEWHVSSSV